MKYLNAIPILLLFIFTSCEKEDTLQEFETNNTNLIQHLDSQTRSSSNYDLFFSLPWASYITAKILQDSTNVQERNYVISQLNNGVIPLKDLIGNVPANGLSFKVKFADYLNYYFSTPDPEPDDDEERPPCPNCDHLPNESSLSGNDSGNKGFDDSDFFDTYAAFMLNDNCVELYFPNGINATTLDDVTSLGHPLSNATQMSGIRRHIGVNDSPAGEVLTTLTDVVLVNTEYANYYDNIILARPVRSIFLSQCAYPEYSGIDFTDFLE